MTDLTVLSPAERRILIRLGNPNPLVTSIGRRLTDTDEWEIDAADALIGRGLARIVISLVCRAAVTWIRLTAIGRAIATG